MLHRLWITSLVFVLLATAVPTQAAQKTQSLLRVQVGKNTYEGKAVASDKRQFWLMSTDGELNALSFNEVGSFKKISPRFKSSSLVQVRDDLKRRYGGNFEVAANGHYVVCGPRGRARDYAKLFEGIYNRFYSYFRVRKLKVTEPEFPLVALVFPDHASFARYAAGDGVRAVRGLMGYYHHHTNRVALFDPGDSVAAMDEGHDFQLPAWTGFPREQRSFSGFTGAISASTGSSESGLRDTMIHEATHQIAFNTGLHSRIGENPKWIVEGLATVYEAPGIRDGGSHAKTADQINRDRFVWFMNYAQTRRPKGALRNFVAGDNAFNASLLDGYSHAWALSFYLIQTRSSAYARFLNAVAHRDPLKPYGAAERLKDFEGAFGKNLAVLDAQFLKYMKNLAASMEQR